MRRITKRIKEDKESSQMIRQKDKDNSDLVTKKGAGLSQKRPKQDIDQRAARKRDFIQAYKASTFNVSAACRAAGLNRKTFYKWKNSDPNFLQDLTDAEYELKDYLKTKLLNLVEKNNLIATIFACKSLAGMQDQPTKQQLEISQTHRFDQAQMDALVRGSYDRGKYEAMLGLPADT